jgi:hypothetical protein
MGLYLVQCSTACLRGGLRPGLQGRSSVRELGDMMTLRGPTLAERITADVIPPSRSGRGQ